MSALEPKRKRNTDVTAWVLGMTIILLASLDLVVWASVHNVPNPVSKFITEQAGWIATPAIRQASTDHAAR
jgi:hypothetical protein